jgi:hypothetical protein
MTGTSSPRAYCPRGPYAALGTDLPRCLPDHRRMWLPRCATLELRLFLSNGAYGDIMPRVVGLFMFVRGRHRPVRKRSRLSVLPLHHRGALLHCRGDDRLYFKAQPVVPSIGCHRPDRSAAIDTMWLRNQSMQPKEVSPLWNGRYPNLKPKSFGEVLKGASHGLFHTRITYEAGENFGKIVITHQEQ